MDIIIPNEYIGERLLPYVAKLNGLDLEESSIYHLCGQVLSYCVVVNRYDYEYIKDRCEIVGYESLYDLFEDGHPVGTNFTDIDSAIQFTIAVLVDIVSILIVYFKHFPREWFTATQHCWFDVETLLCGSLCFTLRQE